MKRILSCLLVSSLVAVGACGMEDEGEVSEETAALASFSQSIQNVWSGKCLDVPWGATANGTPVNKFTCHGGPAQQFVIEYVNPTYEPGRVRIRKAGTSQCLFAPLTGGAQAVGVSLWPCGFGWYGQTEWFMDAANIPGGTTASFRWAQDAIYCLDVGYANDGTQMQIYRQCHGGTTQRFDIRN